MLHHAIPSICLNLPTALPARCYQGSLLLTCAKSLLLRPSGRSPSSAPSLLLLTPYSLPSGPLTYSLSFCPYLLRPPAQAPLPVITGVVSCLHSESRRGVLFPEAAFRDLSSRHFSVQSFLHSYPSLCLCSFFLCSHFHMTPALCLWS